MSRGCGLDDDELASLHLNEATAGPRVTEGHGPQQQPDSSSQGSMGSWSRAGSRPAAPHTADRTCLKCKSSPAQTVVKQNEAYCSSCLEQGIVQKVRAAAKSKGLLTTGDSVLLAVSGGPSSLALLHCLLQLQNVNATRPERGKVAMSIKVAHVLPPCDAAAAQQQTQSLKAALQSIGYSGDVYVLPLAMLYQQPLDFPSTCSSSSSTGAATNGTPASNESTSTAANSTEQQQQQQQQEAATGVPTPSISSCTASTEAAAALQTLLDSIQDTTGCEDLQQHLQQQLLLLAAATLGCSKLVLGTTATAIARHVISDAAKGRGYSVASDIQLSDARWTSPTATAGATCGEVGSSHADSSSSTTACSSSSPAATGGTAAPVVLQPLRDVSHKEVSELCRLRGWLQQAAPVEVASAKSAVKRDRHGSISINQLADSFINAMTGNLPASVFTILRTASHLDDFAFNSLAAASRATSPTATASAGATSGRSPQQQSSLQQQRFCAVCIAPLPASQPPAAGPSAAAVQQHTKVSPGAPVAAEVLCYSCQRQVLGSFQLPASYPQAGGTQLQQLLALLPPWPPWR